MQNGSLYVRIQSPNTEIGLDLHAKLINENRLLKKIADPRTPLIGNSSFINNLKKNIISNMVYFLEPSKIINSRRRLCYEVD